MPSKFSGGQGCFRGPFALFGNFDVKVASVVLLSVAACDGAGKAPTNTSARPASIDVRASVEAADVGKGQRISLSRRLSIQWEAGNASLSPAEFRALADSLQRESARLPSSSSLRDTGVLAALARVSKRLPEAAPAAPVTAGLVVAARPNRFSLLGESNTYSEMLSDGSIATVQLTPLDGGNAARSVLLVNGVISAEVIVQAVGQVEDAALYQYSASTYSGGTPVMSGTVGPGDGGPLMSLGESRAPVLARALASALRACKSASTAFLPQIARADGDCGYYMRAQLLGLAGMVVSGMSGNIFGFFISALTVANATHAYARCKEGTLQS